LYLDRGVHVKAVLLRAVAPVAAVMTFAGCMASQGVLPIPQVSAPAICTATDTRDICVLYRDASNMRSQYQDVLDYVDTERQALESGSLLAAALTAGYTLFGTHEGNVRASIFGMGLLGAARTQPNRTERIAILSDAIFSLDCLMVSSSLMSEVYQTSDDKTRLAEMKALAADLAASVPLAQDMARGADGTDGERAALQGRITQAQAALARLQEGVGAVERYPAAFRSVQAGVVRAAFTRWETGRGSVDGLVDSILALRTQDVSTPAPAEEAENKIQGPVTPMEAAAALQGMIDAEISLNPARYAQQYRDLGNCAIRAAGG